MRGRVRLILVAAVIGGLALGLALAGCQLTRKDYMAVTIGQTEDQVKKIMGDPRYQFGNQWLYTSDDPRDLAKAVILFDDHKRVVGKSWQNPEKPWENHSEGQLP